MVKVICNERSQILCEATENNYPFDVAKDVFESLWRTSESPLIIKDGTPVKHCHAALWVFSSEQIAVLTFPDSVATQFQISNTETVLKSFWDNWRPASCLGRITERWGLAFRSLDVSLSWVPMICGWGAFPTAKVFGSLLNALLVKRFWIQIRRKQRVLNLYERLTLVKKVNLTKCDFHSRSPLLSRDFPSVSWEKLLL
jgi:hypothetical protein